MADSVEPYGQNYGGEFIRNIEYLSKDEYNSFFIKSAGILLLFVIFKMTNNKASFEIEPFQFSK
jgi:hypothetical protein